MANPKSGKEPRSDASVDSGKLPTAEAPPLSPASEQPQPALESPAAAPIASEAAAAPIAAEAAPPPRLELKPQYKRQALLAASMALAAGFGAVVGAMAWTSPPPPRDVAGLQERAAMQQSIAHLSKQMASLKANLEKANKTAHVQIASVSERLDQAHSEITGISKRLDAAPTPAPATVAAALAPAPASDPDITGSIPPAAQATDVPMPRPAPRIAAVESRPTVVPGWRVRGARRGFVYVQNRGDIFQVVPGARLPGLGQVQAIRHQDGRWVVVTPRGIIVSQRDRRYFD